MVGSEILKGRMAMLRKKVLALLAIAAVGVASPTIALAGGGGAGGFYPGGFDGDPRFRIGWGYGLYPYDYDHDDYNYYDYPYAYNGSYVDNGSCYVVQRRARVDRFRCRTSMLTVSRRESR
jgi:hypothetical protein